jgi:uncharacterized membrane protein
LTIYLESSRSRPTLGRRLGLGFVFLWFLIGGLAHFFYTAAEVKIVPPYIPYSHAVVYLTGLLELLGAFGILIARTRKWAGNGLALLTLCVTPANVYMLQRADLFPQIPPLALVARLVAQIFLLVLIVWCTRPTARAWRSWR